MADQWNRILFGARLADMQDVDYRNTLAIASLIELLVQKGIVTAGELAEVSRLLDQEAERASLPRRLDHRNGRRRGVSPS